MLAFLPWVTVDRAQTVRGYTLVPWRAGMLSPAGDSVLAAYTDTVGNPIRSATLVHFEGEPITGDLSVDRRAELFDFAMALTFTALTRRELCSRYGIHSYANSDSFRLVIQGFQEEAPGSFANSARRRCGHLLIGYAPGLLQYRRAPHVEQVKDYLIDTRLLGAVLDALASPKGAVYEEAIFSFNAANTDSDRTPEQHEVVALVGAFERLLQTKGNANELVPSVVGLVGALMPTDRGRHLARLNAFERQHGATNATGQRIISRSLLEAWIRDLYRVRNAFGHGRRTVDRETSWTSTGHLLLGAHLFPFVVLAALARDSLYQLSDDDSALLYAFPWVAGLRNPLRARLQRGPIWPMAIAAGRDEIRWNRAMAILNAKPKG